FIACSSAAYGYIKPNEVPIKENHFLKPLSPYGVSKATQEMLGISYFENFGLKTVMGRFFNQKKCHKSYYLWHFISSV
ncbi:MAG: GDP-mannose 4,6-dehydratase, partial [Pseudomonadota bacterium]